MRTIKSVCGLCGSNKKKLTKTPCCNNLICNDYEDYVMFSFATNSCNRNHDRYTLCATHYHEKHNGHWQDCKKCKNNFEPEMVAWYGTNEFNFEKLKDVPKFKPKHYEDCKKEIYISKENHIVLGGKVWCSKCKSFPGI